VFTTGKQKAQQALNIYSHIDYLRPYFDVEPKEVLNRLIDSIMPHKVEKVIFIQSKDKNSNITNFHYLNLIYIRKDFN